MRPSDLRPVPDVARAATQDLLQAIRDADAARGRTVLCLSGGGTPTPIYRALRDHRDLPWGRMWIAWGDERMVPPGHGDRNERAARDALLDHVPIPEDQILPWPYVPDADPQDLADAYALQLRRTLGDPGEGPWFDVTLLGLGEDAHTAGLFPGTGGTRAAGLAVATRPTSTPTPRLSLTPEALSASRQVWFLVAGDGKRAALQATLAGGDPERLPATSIRALDELRVYTDAPPA
ncbi:MAG: 6-phosphogluconolactonase [Trueperaceae bacterium]|nr:6-phosphogluconolactonase [Trueperaceae bacterium]